MISFLFVVITHTGSILDYMHGTVAHVLVDGYIACTGDEQVFFNMIAEEGFEYEFKESIIHSYFRNLVCNKDCCHCPEQEKHGMVKHRICACKDVKKPASLLDAFMTSSTKEQQLSLMEEEPLQVETPVKTLLDNVRSVSDDAFLEGDQVKVNVKEENKKVMVDTNEVGR